MSCHVGAITKIVKNSANPMIIWFGGTCCPPNPDRRNESTIMMRVKPVTIIMIDGAKLSTVISPNNCNDVFESLAGVVDPFLPVALVVVGVPVVAPFVPFSVN